ncbi:MAG: hypothetical protein EOP42_00590 [Sphingobacteriaceae bacterium]|nr:MAG: hypothetical protein EOP42_00590 [Sphingobacteriaceae bacterium]
MPAPNSFLKNLNSCPFKKVLFVLYGFTFFFCGEKSSAQILKIEKIRCSLSKDDAASIQKIAQYEIAFYNAVFDTQKNDSLVINVRIYGRKQDFLATPDGTNAYNAGADGYFLAGTHDVYILKTEHVNAALLHELSHAILHQNLVDPPQWLDEGLATYLGSLIVDKNEIYYTPITGRIERIKELADNGTLHLAGFLNNKAKWAGDKSTYTDQYTIAYSIIYFLVKTNLNLIKNITDGLQQNQAPIVTLSRDFNSFQFFQSKYIDFYKNQN